MFTNENTFHFRIFQCDKEDGLLKVGMDILTHEHQAQYNVMFEMQQSMCPHCSGNCEGIDQYLKGLKERRGIDPKKPKVVVNRSFDHNSAELRVSGIPLPEGQQGNNDKAVFEQLLRAECVASSEEGRDTIARIREIYDLMK